MKPGYGVASVIIAGLCAVQSAHAEFDYDQKLSLQSAYVDYSSVGAPDNGDFQIKYEGFANWSRPDGGWPDWSFFLRPWLSYRSDSSVPFLVQDNDTSADVEGGFAELWEFVVTRHRLWGNPALSASLGRQQYSGEYGFWWDDSLESVKLELSDSGHRGFAALASRQYLYNTDNNDPRANETDIAYLFGDYHYGWAAQQWAGIRLLGEADYSSANEVGDEADFTGATVGVQFEGKSLRRAGLNADYHVELAAVYGEFENINSAAPARESIDTRGWLVFTEVGHSFESSPAISRLAVRMALTDSPDTPFSGFFQNTIQSSRASRFSDYNAGLAGSIINLRMTNLRLAGVMSQHELTERSQLHFAVYDLHRRNTDVAVSRTIGLDFAESDGKHIGNVAEARYLWAMYPYALDNEHLTFDVLLTTSYFRGGNALQDDIKDYRFSLDLNLRY